MTDSKTCQNCGKMYFRAAGIFPKMWRERKFCSASCGGNLRWKISPKSRFEELFIPEPNSGCWLWLGSPTSAGYGQIIVDGKSFGAHRYSYSIYRVDPPDRLHVLHTCDNRACVNPEHLYLGTHQDNMRDVRVRERGGRLKLTQDEVREVFSSKAPLKELAAKYGVSKSLISMIRTGKHRAPLQD